jgi:hypothetical protein
MYYTDLEKLVWHDIRVIPGGPLEPEFGYEMVVWGSSYLLSARGAVAF